MKFKTGALLLLVGSMGLLAAGCNFPKYGTVDKELRQELFFRCMNALPAGPTAAKYNDWDEVVAECGRQANNLAWGCVKNCS